MIQTPFSTTSNCSELTPKRKKLISGGEFALWMVFWMLATVMIIFIKQIDSIVAKLGFSGSGIEVMFYFGVVVSFYFIFRLRLKIEKIESSITAIIREMAKNDKNK